MDIKATRTKQHRSIAFITPALFCLIALTFGCASKKYATATIPVQQAFGAVAPETDDAVTPKREMPEYQIVAGDVVEVRIFKNEQFDVTQAVRPDGRITLERIGDVHVSGKTPTEIDELVTQKYKSFVIDPEVTIYIREFGAQKVYVLGEVKTPGVYALEGDMTFLQAVAAAGGAKNTAKLSNVIIMRKNAANEVAATKMNLTRFAKNAQDALQFYAEPLDVIYVPKTFVGNVNSFMTQIYGTILPPLDTYLRAFFWAR